MSTLEVVVAFILVSTQIENLGRTEGGREREREREWERKRCYWIDIIIYTVIDALHILFHIPFVLIVPAARQVEHKIFPQSLCSCMWYKHILAITQHTWHVHIYTALHMWQHNDVPYKKPMHILNVYNHNTWQFPKLPSLIIWHCTIELT